MTVVFPCEGCEGRGYLDSQEGPEKCPTCGGRGYTTSSDNIPPEILEKIEEGIADR